MDSSWLAAMVNGSGWPLALDCCDREIMSWVATTKGVDSTLVATLVADLMTQAVEYRFGPGQTVTQPIEWLTDNGSWRPIN